jgi:hypothetical protein
MKLSQAKEYLPFVQATAEGKTIQYKPVFEPELRWIDIPIDYEFVVYKPQNLRIKPESKLRPWKPEEVPVGALLRFKGCKNLPTLILNISTKGNISWINNEVIVSRSCEYLHLEAEHSLDHGVTWKPCGVME